MERMEVEEEVPNSKGGEERIRGRIDYTEERTPSQRRLDAFARLLAAHSECVAVSIINEKLCITANELFQGTPEETILTNSLHRIAGYFQGIAQSKKYSNEERETMFLEICSTSRFKATYPTGLAAKIAKSILNGKDPSISEILKEHGSNADLAGQLYGAFRKLFKDFSKLEEALNPTSQIMNPQQLKAFKEGYEIFFLQTEQKVHAEVQMLEELIKFVNSEQNKNEEEKEIYIGISKLRCLCCRCMLETANEIFKEDKINIKVLTRGQHDFLFENWICPDLFRKGYRTVQGVKTRGEKAKQREVEESEKARLEFKIGSKSRFLIETVSEQAKESGVSMEASQSDSDSESVLNEKIAQRQASLQESLRLFQDLAEGEASKVVVRLSIAIDLYKIEDFTYLYKQYMNQEDVDDEELERAFFAIQRILNSKKKEEEKITSEELIKIFKNPLLVDEKISQVFNNFDLAQTENKTAFIRKKPASTSADESAAYKSGRKLKSSTKKFKLEENPEMLISFGNKKEESKKEEEKPSIEFVSLNPKQEAELGLRRTREPQIDPNQIPKDAESVLRLGKKKKS